MAEILKFDTGDAEIVIVDEPDGSPEIGDDGISRQETGDGGMIIDFAPAKPGADAAKELEFYDNLCSEISADDLNHIAEELLDAIVADDTSRADWLETRARGIDLLALKPEDPESSGSAEQTGGSTQAMVRHPLLQEACIRFQSNASAELLPTSGPAKVRDDTPPKPDAKELAGMGLAAPPPAMGDNGGPPLDDDDSTIDSSTLAEALEKDFNHYLTTVDRGYRPDTDRMLFWVGFGGCGFKKIYHCPIKRMPLSRSVAAQDLIVNHAANDFDDCGRITHRIKMRRSQLIRMRIAGVYRDVPGLTRLDPVQETDPVAEKMAEVKGITTTSRRPEDGLFTILECYCELDLPGFEHKEKGEASGLELPYRVTIEKETRQILEIRRNWRKDDANCLAKRTFVKYPFIPYDGFYEIGLLNILGNPAKALTAAWRIMLDNGMFANYPGFLYGSTAGRQKKENFRINPGEGMQIQTGGLPINQMVMPLPYKDVSAGFVALAAQVETTSQRVGGTAELQVGEGKQDAPVGTTLALIEQATKMIAAVHVRLHAAQSDELQLLKERFQEDPEAFIRCIKKPSRAWEAEEFKQALEDHDIVPAADPNTPSHMHRIMKAVAIKQLQSTSPQLYDAKAVDEMILKMIGVENPSRLFAPPPPPGAAAGAPQIPTDPNKMADIQFKEKKAQSDAMQSASEIQAKGALASQQADSRQKEIAQESADRAQDRASRERVASARERTEAIKTAGQMMEKGVDPTEALQHAENLLAPAGSDQGASPADTAPTPQPQATAPTSVFGGPLPSARPGTGALKPPPVGWKTPI